MPKLLRRILIVAIATSIWIGLVAISYKGFTSTFKLLHNRSVAQQNIDSLQQIDEAWIDILLVAAINMSISLTAIFSALGPLLAWRLLEYHLLDWDEDDPNNPKNWHFWGE